MIYISKREDARLNYPRFRSYCLAKKADGDVCVDVCDDAVQVVVPVFR